MFCNKCGNQIEEGASFCTQCGAKVVYNEEVMDAQIHTSDVGDEQMSDKLDVVLMDVGVNKVSVIRTVREWTGLGLKEAKELVEKVPVLLRNYLENVYVVQSGHVTILRKSVLYYFSYQMLK